MPDAIVSLYADRLDIFTGADLLWRLVQLAVGVLFLIIWKSNTFDFEEDPHYSDLCHWTCFFLGVTYGTIAVIWLLFALLPESDNGKSVRGLGSEFETENCTEVAKGVFWRYWKPARLVALVGVAFLYFTLLHKLISDHLIFKVDDHLSLHRWTVLHRLLVIALAFWMCKAAFALDRMGVAGAFYVLRNVIVFFVLLFLFEYNTIDRRIDTDPHPGWYTIAIVFGGLFIACEIYFGYIICHSVSDSAANDNSLTVFKRMRAILFTAPILRLLLWYVLLGTILGVFGYHMMEYHKEFDNLKTNCSMHNLEARVRYGPLRIHDPAVTNAATLKKHLKKCTSACTGGPVDNNYPCNTSLENEAKCCARLTAIFTLGEYRPAADAVLQLLVSYHIVYGFFGALIEIMVILGNLTETVVYREKKSSTSAAEQMPLTFTAEPAPLNATDDLVPPGICHSEIDEEVVAAFDAKAETAKLVPDPVLVLGEAPEEPVTGVEFALSPHDTATKQPDDYQ